jgi:molecular chaperone DnaK
VTATERATGLAKHVVIDNAMERFRKRQRSDALDRLEAVMATGEAGEPLGLPAPEEGEAGEAIDPELRSALDAAEAMMAKAERVLPSANAEDADELRAMLDDLQNAVQARSPDLIRSVLREVEDLVFYLEDA